MGERFDPVVMLRELEDAHVSYVVIGALAGVLRGTGETTRELVICPRMEDRNLEWLAGAVGRLGAVPSRREPRLRVETTDATPHVFATAHGALVVQPYPAGSKGWEDLRRRADRLEVASALRVSVAASEDLLRLLTSRGRDPDRETLARYRHAVDLERTLDRGISL